MPDTARFYCLRSLGMLGLLLVATGVGSLGPFAAHGSSLRQTPIVRAVAEARPAVVNIHGRKTIRSEPLDPARGDAFRQVNGMGTGVIVDERGYILTNYHVVDGVSRIQVTLADQQNFVARLVARDPKTDLAILKIPSDEVLPVIRIGTSSDLMLGEPVIAVGNAYGYPHTVTRGIVSALDRAVQVSEEQKYARLIQTDASINPGNSGGPLLNIDGEMVGVNVAVRVGAQGIGFAIPVDDAMEIAARLLNVELLEDIAHGVVGQTLQTDGQPKFVVQSVRQGSPAQQGGLQPGDVITAVAQRKICRSLDFERALLGCRAGEQLEVQLDRNEQSVALKLVVGGAGGPGLVADADPNWQILGLRLAPITPQAFRQVNSRYRGGLKVVDVRPSGPAAEQGIRRGDILVGMHKWETITLDNVTYILANPDFEQAQPVKFFILRGGETLYGHLRFAAGRSK